MKTDLYEYLNEILFNKVDDLDSISEYAVHLGCQKEKLKDKIVYTNEPLNTGKGINAKVAHRYTRYFFNQVVNKNIALIPEGVKQGELKL